MDLVRISTAGSVDDGKSTLIGRLLYDNNALTIEQEELIKQKTDEKKLKDLDFSVLTDGLVAEREQGITIDVAHIYFSSNTRKFIIADSPGHLEYTRNMVTGASNAEMSIILIDARKGLLEQSYRHFFISHLLRLDTIIFCINKMDLVDYNQKVYNTICTQIQNLLSMYDNLPNIEIIPISSLKGDNVVHKSQNMTWYTKNTLNETLHTIIPEKLHVTEHPFRMDIQNVLHIQNDKFIDYRAYSGRIASGKINLGDTIIILPSKRKAKITEIRQFKDLLDTASERQSINISIDTEIDISRGMMFTKEGEQHPLEEKRISATIVWLNETQANVGDKFILKSGVKEVQSKIQTINYSIPPEQPNQQKETSEIKLNDILKIQIVLSSPIFMDTYSYNKANGAFILIDPSTNDTCAVGFVN